MDNGQGKSYRFLDIGTGNISAEIGNWSSNFPAGTKSGRRVLNKVIYLWHYAVVNNYNPPGCWLSYAELSKDVKLRDLSRKTIGRSIRDWHEQNVLVINPVFFDDTKGRKSSWIELHSRWYNEDDIILVDNYS